MSNYSCHVTSCLNEVKMFFFKGPKKVLSCAEHFSVQQPDYYSIESYNFITCVEDVAIYKERKAMVARGLQRASVLEGECRKETAAAYAHLAALQQLCTDMVQKRFEDISRSIEKRESYVLTQLSSLRENLNLFETAKDKTLTKCGQLACMESKCIPRFIRLAAEDVSDAIANLIVRSWSISALDLETAMKCLDEKEVQEEIKGALVVAESQCRKGIKEALEYVNSFDSTQFRERIAQCYNELLQYELASETLRVSWLQGSWDLRYSYQINDAETMAVGLRLSKHMSLFSGKYENAEQMLRHAYLIGSSEKSKLLMQICCELCGVAFHRGRTSDVENLCTWFLREFQGDFCATEEILKVKLYLAFILWIDDRTQELDSLTSSWSQQQPINSESTILQLMINSLQVNREKGEALLVQAIDIASNSLLTSVFVALAWYLLSYMSRDESRKEECWRESRRVFTAVAPASIYSGHCLHRLGSLCVSVYKWKEAKKHLTGAQSCYETAAPRSEHVATNLYRIGTMYEEQLKKSKAEKAFEAAQEIFAEIGDKKMEETAKRSYSRVHSKNIFQVLFSKRP